MTSPHITAPLDPPAPRRTRSPGRLVVAWLGGLTLAGGLLVAVAGGALAFLFGADGALQSTRQDLATPTAALVSEPAAIDDTDGATDVLGETRLRVRATPDGGKPVFVGVARTADVDRYLDGIATDQVTDFDIEPWDADLDRRAGRVLSAAAPASQDFWIDRSVSGDSGTAAIDWKLRDGSYRFVVMNADGSPRVDTETSVGIKAPNLGWMSLGIALVGLVAAGAGAALLRRR
jgi:hypothetical protein